MWTTLSVEINCQVTLRDQIVTQIQYNELSIAIVECDISKFKSTPITEKPYVMVLGVQRKLRSDRDYTVMAAYQPYFAPEHRKFVQMPPGESWDVTFTGGEGFNNKKTMKVVIVINSLGCTDTGLYRCYIHPPGTPYSTYSEPYNFNPCGKGENDIVKLKRYNGQLTAVVECDIAKFKDSEITVKPYLMVLAVQRKLTTDRNYTLMAAYQPYYAPEHRKFVVKKNKYEDHFYYGNKTGTLSCEIEVSGATVNFKKWLFHGEELKNTNKKYKADNATLIIERPNRDDAGPYAAVFEIIKGDADPIEYKCEVDYTAGPLVMDLAKSINLEKGDDLKISCEVKGYPKAVVFWQRDQQNLTGNDTIFSEFKGYKAAQIEIKDLQFDDAGNYTCTAYSVEFQNSSTKSIIVRVKDPIAWIWPLIGILVEILILAVIILICNQVEKRKRAKELDSIPGNSQREKDE
ncbi:hypothetical protein Btru_032738 [Bulinus truncatus]|nr:hypothetical protein Btru_032738 [Bulinus truncatus]